MRLNFVTIILSVLSISCAESAKFGLNKELEKTEIAQSHWELPTDQAALMIANSFSKQHETIKIIEHITPVSRGYITYGGASNSNIRSNNLIRFNDKTTEYTVKINKEYQGYHNERHLDNTMVFKCEKLDLGKRTQKACAIIQHFDGMALNTSVPSAKSLTK